MTTRKILAATLLTLVFAGLYAPPAQADTTYWPSTTNGVRVTVEERAEALGFHGQAGSLD